MSERHEIWAVADALQMDLRAASAKLVELRARIAGLNLSQPDPFPCPECGLGFRGERGRDEHVYRVHEGPVPSHWLEEVA